jgi:hypothetical protein
LGIFSASICFFPHYKKFQGLRGYQSLGRNEKVEKEEGGGGERGSKGREEWRARRGRVEERGEGEGGGGGKGEWTRGLRGGGRN